MKKTRIVICALAGALLSAFLGGCGGEAKTADHTFEEAEEESAESLYSCWKYEDEEIWLVIYDDYACTYDLYRGDDETGITGSYQIYDDELRLDCGPSFTADENGNLINAYGSVLYPSELPDFAFNISLEEAEGLPLEEEADYSDEAEGSASFYGCWKYDDSEHWLVINDDFDCTYDMYIGDDETHSEGNYRINGGELRLDSEARFTFGENGSITDEYGNVLYPSELPDFAYEISSDSSEEEYNREEDDLSDDDYYYNDYTDDDSSVDYTVGDEATLSDFLGCWEYNSEIDKWLCIREDGVYECYDENGFSYDGSYSFENNTLYLNQDGVSLVMEFGSITGSDGSSLYPSILPDFEGTLAERAADFIGCWEDSSGSVWLEIYSSGTYRFTWTDRMRSEGRYVLENGELILQNGLRFVMDYENGRIYEVGDTEGTKYTMFPSELPDYLQ